jgi:hypothetical protein
MRAETLSLALSAALVVVACSGKQAGSSHSAAAPNLSDACASLAPSEAPACRAGEGAACRRLGERISQEVTMSEDLRRRTTACMLSTFERGCALRDVVACVRRANYGQYLHDEEPYRMRACDLEVKQCAELADLYAPAPAGRAPNPKAFERAAEKACDLGNPNACFELAHARLPGGALASNPKLALDAWEWGCQANGEINMRCDDLRQFLLAPDAPKRDSYDALPALAATGEVSASEPASAYARRIGEIDRSCAGGDARVCLRRAELEWMRWTHSIVLDRRNVGTPARFDVNAELERLCRSGVGDACLERSFRGILASPPEVEKAQKTFRTRGCDAGSPRACVRVAHELRAHDVSGSDRSHVAELFARGCRAGLRWACEEPDRLE